MGLPIKTADIIASARRATGLTDIGEEGFLVGLNTFVDSLNKDVTFSVLGRGSMVDRLIRIVENRLRFTADLAAHPEILQEKLLPPVAIIGLPRVGSTKLHRMLASSGSFQEPLFWQVFNPARVVPFTGEDPRIEKARRYVEWRNSTNPAANAAHHIAVHDVEEESFLLEFSFESMYQMAFVPADSYYEWLQTVDHSYTYDYLFRLLKYLQWQFHREAPRPWILKSPPNLGYEAQILKYEPGTKFIMPHRDPVTVVSSVAALVVQSRRLYCENIDNVAIGKYCIREFSTAIRRHMSWRKANPHIRILDISYRDTERAPMDVVRESYAFLGLPLTDEVAMSIQDWLAADRHGTAMRHEYSLDTCGLTEVEIRNAFADYAIMFESYLRE